MKRILFLLVAITTSVISFAQTITFQAGTSISNLNWELTGTNIPPLYGQKLIGYSVFAGIDYFDRKYLTLSSNIGMIRKGGKDEITYYDIHGNPLRTETEKPSLDFVSLNTTVDFKYPIKEKIIPFICIGPKVDYLVNQSGHFDGIERFGNINPIAFGFVTGGGIKYDLSVLQLGVRALYYIDKTAVAEWTNAGSNTGGEINTHTFAINLSVGYKLN